MSILGDITGAIGKVTSTFTKALSDIGGMVKQGLERLGLPSPIASLIADACDPMHAMKDVEKAVDEVAKDLGLPESLRKGLHKVLDKAQEIAKKAVTEGVGGVVREVGKDLGLPPALVDSVALGVNVVTGNEAAAAGDALRLAGDAATALGVPKEVQDFTALGADLLAGDTDALKKDGAQVFKDVVDHVQMPAELRDGIYAAADFASGNTAAAKKDLGALAGHFTDDLPLPDAVKTALHLGVDKALGDEDAARAHGAQLASQLLRSLGLPAEAQKVAAIAADLVKGDVDAAAKKLGMPKEKLAAIVDAARHPDLQALKDAGKAGAQAAAAKMGIPDATFQAGLQALLHPNAESLKAFGGQVESFGKEKLVEMGRQKLEDAAKKVGGRDWAALADDLSKGDLQSAAALLKERAAGRNEQLRA